MVHGASWGIMVPTEKSGSEDDRNIDIKIIQHQHQGNPGHFSLCMPLLSFVGFLCSMPKYASEHQMLNAVLEIKQT